MGLGIARHVGVSEGENMRKMGRSSSLFDERVVKMMYLIPRRLFERDRQLRSIRKNHMPFRWPRHQMSGDKLVTRRAFGRDKARMGPKTQRSFRQARAI